LLLPNAIGVGLAVSWANTLDGGTSPAIKSATINNKNRVFITILLWVIKNIVDYKNTSATPQTSSYIALKRSYSTLW
jgi:hypothetical protein